MILLKTIVIAISLAMDAFAVSISLSILLKNPEKRQKFRVYFHFGLFQFLFPLIGYFLVNFFSLTSYGLGKKIGGSILIFLGLKIIYEALKKDEKDLKVKGDITRGFTLILFASGVSIDAFSIGVSMAFLHEKVILLSILAGVFTSFLSFIGITYGKFLGKRLGEYSEIVAGIVLLFLGVFAFV